MRTSKRNELISEPGWDGVWAIYSACNFRRSVILPITLSTLALIASIYSGKTAVIFIKYISNAILLIAPAVLGFTLSGYALMMGLSNSNFIQRLARYKEDGKNYSMFQSLNATFAVVLLMAFITTITGIGVELLLNASIEFPSQFVDYCEIYNWACLYFIMFLLFYTINAIKDVVINIFSFGQYVQACIDSEIDIDDMNN